MLFGFLTKHLQQTLLLGFSSPTPQKEVAALINLELSGDATSSRPTMQGVFNLHCMLKLQKIVPEAASCYV